MNNRSTKLLLDEETSKELIEIKKKIHKCDCEISDLENWIYQNRFKTTGEIKIEKNKKLKELKETKTNFQSELNKILDNYTEKLKSIYKDYNQKAFSLLELENEISKFRNLKREFNSDLLKCAEFDFWISFWKEKRELALLHKKRPSTWNILYFLDGQVYIVHKGKSYFMPLKISRKSFNNLKPIFDRLDLPNLNFQL